MTPITCPDCGRPLPLNAPAGMCPACLLRLAEPAPAPEGDSHPVLPGSAESGDAPAMKPSAAFIGRYKLLEIIGEGGFGTVWIAEQQEPVRRNVALKIIKLGMDTRQVVARFEAERQALALMDHANIARVFDAGATDAGRPYFVMELVRGLPITEFCHARQLSIPERIELLITVCQAVQHAHQKGVIHRDLKPSNILVTEQDGRAVPKVIDFGVAKAIEEPLTDKTLFTRFAQFLGTPAYMSPEQAGLGGLDIDTRSDVYSLGVLLYELLTGGPPLDPRQMRDASHEAVLKTIREVEPPKPSARLRETQTAARADSPPALGVQDSKSEIDPDLDWIVLKALEKDRARRYDTANSLAADLRHCLDNEPITARPPSRLYRLRKLALRYKLAFAAAAAVLVALVAGLAATGWQALEARRNLAQARLNAYVSELNVAHRAITENNLTRAIELLTQQRPRRGEKNDLRGFEWWYLWHACRSNQLHAFSTDADAVAFSPDGRLLAAGGRDGIVVFEAASRQILTNLPGHALSLAFSPRASILAAGESAQVRLWNTETWTEARAPLTHTNGVGYPARFSPDGAWLLTSAPHHPWPRHRLFRTDTWEEVASCPGRPELPWQLRNVLAFSPDGSLVVTPWPETTNVYCSLKLWKVPTLAWVADLSADSLPLWSASFLPDGQHLLMGTFNGDLVVWNVPRRQVAEVINEYGSGITSIAVANGASIFATTSHDDRISLWDSRTFRVVSHFHSYQDSIWASALSPDGKQVVTGSFDGSTKLWDGTVRDAAQWITNGSLIAGFTPDGGTLVLAPWEADYRWHLVGTIHREIAVPATPPLATANYIHRPFDVLGTSLLGALGRTDGTLELWDLTVGRLSAAWSTGTNALTAVTFSPDGHRLVTGDAAAQVRLWDVATRRELNAWSVAGPPRFPGENQVSTLTFSADARRLVAGCWPGFQTDVVVLDLETGRPTHRLPIAFGNATTAALSPDGRLLACATMGGRSKVYLFDLESAAGPRQLRGHVTGIVEVTFSPDGKTLATGGYDTVRLWNVATEREVLSLPARGTFRGLCFSPDGETLAAAYLTYPGHRVHLYRAPRLEGLSPGHRGPNPSLAP